MKNYTIIICTNNETLRGGRSIVDGLLNDACVEACDTAADIFHDVIGALPVSDDCFDLETNGTFADWNGGRMSGDQYFRVAGAQKHGHVVIKCDDIDAEIPQELVALAESMHDAMVATLDDHDVDTIPSLACPELPPRPVLRQSYRPSSNSGDTYGVDLTLADGVAYAYIQMNGKTYYIDDTTGEGIAECFDAPCSCVRCPSCDKHYSGVPALSRRDNKTEICSACGTQEAMEDYRNAT